MKPDWSFVVHNAVRSGKTYQTCKAAKEIDAAVVTASREEAQRLAREYGVRAFSVADMRLLKGHNRPILFDPFGVARICMEYERELALAGREIQKLKENQAGIEGDEK